MARTGTKLKVNTLKQQREAAELESIIEEFGRAMRSANRDFISGIMPGAPIDGPIFTLNMKASWIKYEEFCLKHPDYSK